MFLSIVLWGLYYIVAVAAQVPSIPFDCTGRANGIYPDPNNCQQHFICDNGLTTTLKCLNGMLYNPIIQSCDSPQNVNCSISNNPVPGPSGKHSFSCVGKLSNFYPSPYSCDEYYICTTGRAVLAKCYTGLLFNATLKYCDLPANVHCLPGQYVPPMTTLQVLLPPLVSTHAPTPGSTAKHLTRGSTLAPQLRSTTQQSRATTRRHRLTSRTTVKATSQRLTTRTNKHQQTTKIIPFIPLSTQSQPARTTVPLFLQQYTICRGQPDSLIRDPFDCSSYYRCYFQLGIKMQCSYGKVFHEAIQACDYPQNVPGCH